MPPVLSSRASFTRPDDTDAYTANDLVANDTDDTLVAPMTFRSNQVGGRGGMLRRAILRKSGTGTTNADFTLLLYSAEPTPTNGDNGAYETDEADSFLGAIDITVDTAFSDGAVGIAIPNVGSEINVPGEVDIVYGLLKAAAAYTPAAQEVFTVDLEILPA